MTIKQILIIAHETLSWALKRPYYARALLVKAVTAAADGSVPVPSTGVQQSRAAPRRSVLRRELHSFLLLSLIAEPYPNNVLFQI